MDLFCAENSFNSISYEVGSPNKRYSKSGISSMFRKCEDLIKYNKENKKKKYIEFIHVYIIIKIIKNMN